MALSRDIKIEIIKKGVFKNDLKSLVQGLFMSAGSLIISEGKLSFDVSNECEEVIELLAGSLKSLYGGAETSVRKVSKSFKNKERFELSIAGDSCNLILTDLGIIKSTDSGTDFSDLCDRGYNKSKSSMVAFLIGMFLGSGTVSAPNDEQKKHTYGYHFEICTTTQSQADMVAEVMSNFDIFPKIVSRNEEFVIYVKNSETICDILSIFGASKAVLELQSQKVSRDVSNNTNRQINCISANIDKSVNAALKQLAAIEVIQSTIGIENLPDVLAEAALSRLANPEGSLSELLLTLESKITKGALAQRFDKIIKIAEELGDKNEE